MAIASATSDDEVGSIAKLVFKMIVALLSKKILETYTKWIKENISSQIKDQMMALGHVSP